MVIPFKGPFDQPPLAMDSFGHSTADYGGLGSRAWYDGPWCKIFFVSAGLLSTKRFFNTPKAGQACLNVPLKGCLLTWAWSLWTASAVS